MTNELDPNVDARKLPSLDMTTAGVIIPKDWDEVITVAQYMAKAGAMIPKHLQGNPSMCMGIIMDASAWGLNPFRLATQHMVVNGIGSYMSQAITAAINRKAPIKGRLVADYIGDGNERQCVLNPITTDGQSLPYTSPKLGDITPKNSPLWKVDPDQQLFYFSSRAWTRRYFPDLLMGAYDVEEARSMKDITPKEGVKNFLEDEGEATGVVLTEDMKPLDPKTVEVGDAVLFDEQTGEIYPDTTEPVKEPPLVIPPEVIARNLISSLRGETDTVRLEQWQNTNQGEINALPPALLKDVRKALADKFLDLAEL